MREFGSRELNHLAVDHELPLVRELAEFAQHLLGRLDDVQEEVRDAVKDFVDDVRLASEEAVRSFAGNVRAAVEEYEEEFLQELEESIDSAVDRHLGDLLED